jgi:hypothetical protein
VCHVLPARATVAAARWLALEAAHRRLSRTRNIGEPRARLKLPRALRIL